jgi:DNA repair protein RecN (Recombination protein N)
LTQSWHHWAEVRQALEQARQQLSDAKAEEDWLRDAVQSLDHLAPQTGEEASLLTERTRLANISKIGESMAVGENALFGDTGAQNALGMAVTAFEKAAELAGGPLDEALSALQRAEAELAEAGSLINAASNSLEADPRQLEQLDDRLHALRQQARKHNCDTDALPQIHQTLAASLPVSKTSPDKLVPCRTPPHNGKSGIRIWRLLLRPGAGARHSSLMQPLQPNSCL